jgi:two-component system chemotaxis response regulator CheB
VSTLTDPHESAFDLLVIAASLGGPSAIRQIVSGLPDWFPLSVLVVQHRTPAAQDVTVELLKRAAHLPVELARAGDRPRPGLVHVMPADQQLVIGARRTYVRIEDGHASSADPVFRSAAAHFGPRTVGVVLSGSNDDGAAGAAAIKHAGGRVLTQDRATARCFTMPAATIATGCVDLVLPVGRLADAVISLATWPGAAALFHVPLAPWAVLP